MSDPYLRPQWYLLTYEVPLLIKEYKMKKILIGISILTMLTMLSCAPRTHALLSYNSEFYFNENIPFMIRIGEAKDTNGDGKKDTAVCYYSFKGFSSPNVIAYFEIIGEQQGIGAMDYVTKPRAFVVGFDSDFDGKIDIIYTDTNNDGILNKEERFDNSEYNNE